MEFPKSKAETLGSSKDLVPFFHIEGDLVCCNDIRRLVQSLNISYNPEEWRLLMDCLKTTLKAVLLYNGNILPSIPVGHEAHMKNL